MVTHRNIVYEVINEERDYQDSKWNEDTTASGGKHSNTEFLVYIRDYVEQALHYASRNSEQKVLPFTQDALRKIAALAVAAMEQNGVINRTHAPPTDSLSVINLDFVVHVHTDGQVKANQDDQNI